VRGNRLTIPAYIGDVSTLLAAAPTALLQAKYSQDLEREADDYGAALLMQNGMSPALLAGALKKLAESHSGATTGGYLSSHPSTDERMRHLRHLSRTLHNRANTHTLFLGCSMENFSLNESNWLRVPARQGIAAKVARGQTVKIVNTSGKQVVDTWAFNTNDLDERLSMEHSRVSLRKLVPAVGDTLVTNYRRPMLSFVEDSTAGHHDMLMAACDVHRYEQLGAIGHHDNCSDNLRNALRALGLSISAIPSPLNLFMNVPWTADGSLTFERPTSEAGQHVSLRAEMDLVIVFSACPQEMIPVNDMKSADVHVGIS
jgi:uncharacterized protein